MKDLPAASDQCSVGTHTTGASEKVRIRHSRTAGRKAQSIQDVIAVITLVVCVIEHVECISPQLHADTFGPGNLEVFVQGEIELVEGRAATGVSSQVAVEQLEINDLSGKSIHSAAPARATRSQEGVLD